MMLKYQKFILIILVLFTSYYNCHSQGFLSNVEKFVEHYKPYDIPVEKQSGYSIPYPINTTKYFGVTSQSLDTIIYYKEIPNNISVYLYFNKHDIRDTVYVVKYIEPVLNDSMNKVLVNYLNKNDEVPAKLIATAFYCLFLRYSNDSYAYEAYPLILEDTLFRDSNKLNNALYKIVFKTLDKDNTKNKNCAYYTSVDLLDWLTCNKYILNLEPRLKAICYFIYSKLKFMTPDVLLRFEHLKKFKRKK